MAVALVFPCVFLLLDGALRFIEPVDGSLVVAPSSLLALWPTSLALLSLRMRRCV